MKSNSTLKQENSARSRSPNGANSTRVSIALFPDERRALLELANRDGRSVSSMARVLMLRSMVVTQSGEV